MILTITANPSLDFLYEADTLLWDDANRVDPPRRRPGGQGINVARAVQALGGQAAAVALLGGSVGDDIARCLESESLPLRSVPISLDTRVFTGVRVRGTGSSLLLNPRGPTVSVAEADAFEVAARRAIHELRPRWVACCGSVPPGVDAQMYARIGYAAREAGCRFVADCDDSQLQQAAALCDLLVPNHHEACRLLGRDVTPDSAGDAVLALLELGPRWAAITLGAAGAVLATGGHAWRAEPPQVPAGSAVGAGDAFLASLLLALTRNDAPEDALRAAVATGSAVLLGTGADLFRADDVQRLIKDVRITAMQAV